MSKNRVLSILLALLLVPALLSAAGHVTHYKANGIPSFVDGDLGHVTFKSPEAGAKRVLQGVLVDHFGAAGDEEMQLIGTSNDNAGNSYFRFQQTIDGMTVHGATMVVRSDANGRVNRVNGDFAAGVRNEALLGAEKAMDYALGKAMIRGERTAPELAYVLDGNGEAVLSWMSTVSYENAVGPQRDIVFADAASGHEVFRVPTVHYGRSLATYSCVNTSCGNLISNSSNNINTGDAAIDAAHNYAVATYDYYFANHGRDSIDDNGMTLVSRAHYGNNYNNAFWNGSQMTYGDGDGTTFIPLSQDADVVAHELTHGVTERSSNLVYSNESGALNEALSDIFGAMVDRQEGANTVDTWLLGEDIYTPGINGDGLRVMNDPVAAGDYDYYPTRYTGTSDNGGVHWNSGIANLAFVLLVEGGTHPRGKTSVVVPAIGFSTAADIFYCANVNCMTSRGDFEDMRACTAGCTSGATADAVNLAWDAVAVPGGGGSGSCSPVGASCSAASDCCSNKCKGKSGSKTCK